ncbi:MAG: DUF349 domain-containing protein, partial [Prevotellaceae bacterium]|nr:DUF349 domain-containing protein [Prevotellaceae bacterium]
HDAEPIYVSDEETLPAASQDELQIEEHESSNEAEVSASPDAPEANEQAEIRPQELVDLSDEETQPAASQDELQIEEHEDLDEADASASPANFYDGIDRQTLVDTLAKLLGERPIQEIKGEVEAIKVAFYKRLEQDEEQARSQHVARGEAPEDFVWPDDGVEAKLKDQLAVYKKLRTDYAMQLEKERDVNLEQKLALIEELKLLLERQDDFNKIFSDFKALQSKWRVIGAVPLARQKDVWEAYNYNVEKFYDVVKINRELRELDFKKNFELKQLLCEKAEEALLETDVVKVFRSLQKYHEQWREVGPVAAEYREPLWERFKNVSAQINKKYTDHFEAVRIEQQNNLNLKLALCEQAEELQAETPPTLKVWNEKTQLLLEMQKMWKTIGAMPRKESGKTFQRFRAACNAFFDNRRDYFTEQRNEQNSNLQQKLDLCAQAEVLADSSEWKKTSDELVKLQAQWKNIGSVSHKQSEVVWARFRAACNKFFQRKKDFFATQDARYDENLKKKEELIAEIKSYTSAGNPSEKLTAIKDFQHRWAEIGFVSLRHKEQLQSDYRVAIDALFNALKISPGERQIMEFKSRMASTADKGDKRTFSLEQERLQQQLRKLESDVKLWENNIGFFAHSKNAGALVQNVKDNIDKAKREVVVVKEKLKVLATAGNKPEKNSDNAQRNG